MKLLGSTGSKITKDKNGENFSNLEITELVLFLCNYYQQDSRILYIFVPNKRFDTLLENSPTNHIFFNSRLQEISIWSTNQNSKPLEVEDKINLKLIIK